MDVKIKEFEKAAIEAVSALRNKLGAQCVDINVRVDNYDKGCTIGVKFYSSIPADASRVPGCGPDCKGD